ncbi:MAG: hypothetical protein COV10_04680 [Candidatus Vogelbacteria bacterium CG10_big_fil_rev_8_21_14_0_10_51_16]|uniref:Uncharacterized protein n=1 Tax=Candidatus Vogelbacteria bacterium CG10_big_fil_rev_8_21_14_0_10_51_16 TaxID=1975045 RepID=A0A2H0RF24_9BACT|nr:MAG: hypothetical protein COV10_04680 [Candidatus Vogelbacteria bacterium CG10_big_fil_rev_8_21_14_0_10_51_16]
MKKASTIFFVLSFGFGIVWATPTLAMCSGYDYYCYDMPSYGGGYGYASYASPYGSSYGMGGYGQGSYASPYGSNYGYGTPYGGYGYGATNYASPNSYDSFSRERTVFDWVGSGNIPWDIGPTYNGNAYSYPSSPRPSVRNQMSGFVNWRASGNLPWDVTPYDYEQSYGMQNYGGASTGYGGYGWNW